MAADDRHIDGNGLAGLLTEAFGHDMTSVERRCGDCGMTAPLAAHMVYRGAGYVARCPGCDSVALKIGLFEGSMTLSATGFMTLPRAG